MRHIESGRSMVEILGVLAVIGVLSVGGIYGYRLAMDKHKANDVQEAMRLRANDASHQMLNGTAPAPFDDDIGGILMDIGSVKDVDATPGADDPQFAIHLQNIPEGVARHLINSNGGIGAGVVGIKDSHLSHLVTSLNDLTPNGDGMYDLAYIFDSTMEANCPAGQYINENKCTDCPEGKVCTGGADYAECPSAQEPNAKRSACVPCAEGEVCGCPKGKADGNGKCVECIKNSDCNGKVCSDALCHPCPNKGDCSGEKGFTCSAGYHPKNHLCCPDHANCSDETGELVISCEEGYYLSEGICLECPHGATCVGGMTTFACKSEYKKQGTICCPTGATCQIIGNDYRVSCPKNTYVHDKDCLPCPTGLTCKGGEEMPTCQAGYIFDGAACKRANCQPEQGERYTCYINGKKCGFYCTDTKMGKNSCRGYCSADYCPTGTHWGTVPVGWAGLGCYNNDIYCSTYEELGWLCVRKEDMASASSGINVCCNGSNFGQCQRGTCNPKDCDLFNDSNTTSVWEKSVADRKGGCKITYKNGDSAKIVYCIPYDGKWVCKWEKSNGWNSGICSTTYCTTEELKNKSGNCSKCFGEFSCPASWVGATWNADKKRCVGPGNDGRTYSCDLTGKCYFDLTDNLCANGCTDLTPLNTCGAGYCDATKCKNNNLVYNETATYGGCQTTYTGTGGGAFVFVPGWGGNRCFYGTTENNINTLCGYDCQATTDCSKCKTPLLAQCTYEKCRIDGQEIKNCVCDGDKANASNGHCCPVGQAYVNGACSIYNSTGKCLYKGFYQFDETAEYKANGFGQCQCVDEDKCLKFNEGTISCEFTSAKLKRSASGLCEEVK